MSDNIYQAPVAPPLPSGPQENTTLKSKLFSANGRFSRSQYWAYGVGMSGVAALLMMIPYLVILLMSEGFTSSGGPLNIAIIVVLSLLALAFYVLAAWISIVAVIKRFHDRAKSGTWYFINFIPLVGPYWVLIECGCLVGTAGPNIYGPDPLRS